MERCSCEAGLGDIAHRNDGRQERSPRNLDRVPTISRFYGISIRIHWREHPPPHFHARYAEWEAEIEISTLQVIDGELPKRPMTLTLEWAFGHRPELLENWELCAQKRPPKRIPGLDE